MSTTGEPRITRSASRARSVDRARSVESDAGTVATRAASTRTGGRGSRRGPTPPVEEPTVPKITSKNNRAYGTQGLASPSDQLVADAAHTTALGSIATAVTDAETTQAHGGPGGLSIVNEEEEEGPAGPNEENQTLEFQEQRLSFFSLQYWAPRGENTTAAGYILDGEGRRRTVQVPYAPITDPRVLKWSLILVMFSMFLLVPAYQTLFNHVVPRYLPGFGGTSVHNSSQHQFMPYEYDNLLSRIGNVEHHLKQSSQSFTPKPKQQVNWFLPGFGAVIDPHLSSPIATAECDTTYNFWPWSLSNSCVQKPLSQPHMSALTAWEDPGADRWCAPRSGGKLQLAVEISRNVAPTEVVVEFGAKDATPEGGMGAAPREIELWIQIEDDNMRATIGDVISRMHPHLLKESSPQDKTLSAAQALGNDWVLVGRWTYNIYEHDNIQSFRVPISLHEYGVHTAKVAFRVNSNWGNVMFTCINRLRLHGRDATGIIEELEEDFRGLKA